MLPRVCLLLGYANARLDHPMLVGVGRLAPPSVLHRPLAIAISIAAWRTQNYIMSILLYFTSSTVCLSQGSSSIRVSIRSLLHHSHHNSEVTSRSKSKHCSFTAGGAYLVVQRVEGVVLCSGCRIVSGRSNGTAAYGHLLARAYGHLQAAWKQKN